MKKITSILLAILMLVSTIAMSSCAGEETPTEAPTEEVTEAPEIIPETPYPVDCLRIGGVDIDEFVIVSDTSLGGVMTYAATELQEYIETTTGVRLDIVEGTVPAGTRRILLDGTERIYENSTMGVYTDEDGLILAGTWDRSTLYAVYHFLEEFLGWRFFASDCEVCYETSKIDLTDIDYTFELQYKNRHVFEYEYHDKDISVKRYQNGDTKRRMYWDEHLGRAEDRAPNDCHSFASLAGGGDSGSGGVQPCLNDPTIRETMKNNVRAILDANPRAVGVHVSQNDNENYCKCDACLEDLNYYGTPSGSIIELCNYICEDLETYKDGAYKDVYVITFAYRYSLDAPNNITCHKQLMVEFAIIDFCHQHAFTDTTCDVNVSFIRNNQDILPQIEKWLGICEQFYIWDYGTNCRYYYCPYPTFDVLYDNCKYLSSIGSWGYFYMNNTHTTSAEFGTLRSYVYAKLMEHPDMTREEYEGHIREFLQAYYGPGWEYINNYLEFIQNLSNEKNECFGIYSSPEYIYGDHAFGPYSDQLTEWFDRAEEMASTDAELLHVRRLRISMDYLRIGAIHKEEMTSGDDERVQNMIAQVKTFWDECFELGLTWLTESNTVPTNFDERPDLYEINPRQIIWIHASVYSD